MDLFNDVYDSTKNYLPKDGIVHYYGRIIKPSLANDYYTQLMHDIAWRHDEAIMFGKKIITKRKVAWYGDEPFQYTYSKTTKYALPWIKVLLELKEIVEELTTETYNSCLLNLYHDGSEGMAWHSDDEKDLKRNGAIASVTLGAERKFAFKHKKTKEKLDIYLAHGSLLVMKDSTQTNWLHRLPPTKKIATPRINLTFRTMVNQQL